MTDRSLEGKLKELFNHQVDHLSITPPDPRAIHTRPVHAATDHGPHRNRRRLILLGATVLVAAVAVTVTVIWATPGTVTIGAANDSTDGDDIDRPFDFDSQVGVRLRAAELTVEVGDRTFAPTGPDVDVDGDPGNPPTASEAGYATLELEWFEDGVEMRVFLYFTGDDTHWWVTEIRTRDGADPAEWIVMPGEYLRTPLGQPFIGDLDAGPLHIGDMVLDAFVPRPTSCDGTGPAGDLIIELSGSQPVAGEVPLISGYATTVLVLDAATCDPVEPDNVNFQATVDNPAVAVPETENLRFGAESVDDGELYLDVTFKGPGQTTLTVTAVDPETGDVVASLDIPVTVTNDGGELLAFEDPQLDGGCEATTAEFAEGEPSPSSTEQEAAAQLVAENTILEGLELVDGMILLRGEQIGSYQVVVRPGGTFAVESATWCYPDK